MDRLIDNAEAFSERFGSDPRLTFEERVALYDSYQAIFDQSRVHNIQAHVKLLRLIELNREWLTELSRQIIEPPTFNLSGRYD
jgi:hypothetical protein